MLICILYALIYNTMCASPFLTKVVSSNPTYGQVYSIQLYVLSVTCGRSLGTPVSSTNKTDPHNITEILLKVVFNTLTLSFCNPMSIVLLYTGLILLTPVLYIIPP